MLEPTPMATGGEAWTSGLWPALLSHRSCEGGSSFLWGALPSSRKQMDTDTGHFAFILD